MRSQPFESVPGQAIKNSSSLGSLASTLDATRTKMGGARRCVFCAWRLDEMACGFRALAVPQLPLPPKWHLRMPLSSSGLTVLCGCSDAAMAEAAAAKAVGCQRMGSDNARSCHKDSMAFGPVCGAQFCSRPRIIAAHRWPSWNPRATEARAQAPSLSSSATGKG